MSACEFDVVVVGAGIQGVGAAQAAAAAGQRVLLVEASAPARGTSSRSSKLIHGGLRYLETLQLALVRESLAEREILLRIAPHLVRLVPFFVPVYEETSRPPWKIRAGLSLYAALGDFEPQALFQRVPRAQWDALDGLTTAKLRAVFRYHDGQTDDARLVRTVLASALELGAQLRCPAELNRAERSDGGWRVELDERGTPTTVSCRTLVNAAGPWVARVHARVLPHVAAPQAELVAGTHVEVQGTLERGIYYCEAPSDRRAVFLMPWKGHTLIGTTETPFDGEPADVAPTTHEVDYLIATLQHYMPAHATTVLGAWAGLRVLPRAPGAAFSRPRDVTLTFDEPRAPSVVEIWGGKLTGYRATAHKVLAALAPSLPAATRRADTATLRLPDVP